MTDGWVRTNADKATREERQSLGAWGDGLARKQRGGRGKQRDEAELDDEHGGAMTTLNGEQEEATMVLSHEQRGDGGA
jgi:hypothetical protein